MSESFECSGCGACCKILPKLVAPWLVGENGACKHLKDNKCSIYEDRPIECRIDESYDLKKSLVRLIAQERGITR